MINSIFEPFLKGNAPAVTKFISETTLASGDVRVTRILFESQIDAVRLNQIYAVIASPAEEGGVYPGLLILHGGFQAAEESLAVDYAKQGYIALAPEMPGIASPEASSYSTGHWKSEAYESRHLTALPDARASSVYEGIVAAIQAFDLLKSLPGVQSWNMGVRGLSWGGYAATMVSALLGNQVKAAFSVYGSGFYDKGSYFQPLLKQRSEADRENWLSDLDAGRWAHAITAAFFLEAASNDTFFWPPAVMETLKAIVSDKNGVFSPNDDHALTNLPNAWQQELSFFNYHLKGLGSPLPFVYVPAMERQDDGSLKVAFDVQNAETIINAKLYCSLSNVHWMKREWVGMDAKRISESKYEAYASMMNGSDSFDWYVFITDSRQLSASSMIYTWKGAGER